MQFWRKRLLLERLLLMELAAAAPPPPPLHGEEFPNSVTGNRGHND